MYHTDISIMIQLFGHSLGNLLIKYFNIIIDYQKINKIRSRCVTNTDFFIMLLNHINKLTGNNYNISAIPVISRTRVAESPHMRDMEITLVFSGSKEVPHCLPEMKKEGRYPTWHKAAIHSDERSTSPIAAARFIRPTTLSTPSFRIMWLRCTSMVFSERWSI